MPGTLLFGRWIHPLCLALGAIVGERSEDQVREALDAVPKKKAESLAKALFGTTVQIFRRLYIGVTKNVTNPG